ncbi:MAG TPA: GNAT family protein [Solirubrobacteraceae bacterium]|nr:GNAT family protein [Solirubrobacteraceae bacterium]
MSEAAVEDLVVCGPRVRLRIPREQDAQRLFELASDAEVTRFFSWGPYHEEAEALDWLRTLPARRADGVALELAIADSDDWVIGITGVLEVSRRDRRSVVGTWLGQAYWGTGANAESKALIARLVFEQLRMERLGAWADVRNPRSQRALERLGFVREGTLRAFHRHNDERRDVVAYSLLREEWEQSPLASVPATVVGAAPEAFVCAPR